MSNSLSKELRNQLAKVTLEARVRADEAVRAALENIAVHEKDYRPHMGAAERALRNRLRARGRALGDARDDRTGTQQIDQLAEQAAYEHWHRLLFTRFLVENGRLYSDESFGSVPVTLQECDELASEAGARDGFDLACRFASRTLPGVFRQDDPVLELRLASNDESALRSLLGSLPHDVFRSDDGLGWTYQFWQAQRKDEVNASGTKIGAEELPAVTQLFTEDYMVEFLLHNTLGAWWAGRLGPIRAETEEEARATAALPTKDGLGLTWTYLRFVRDEQTKAWTPAAGNFPGWPTQAKLIRFLDPCMGSGHFLVSALPLLSRLRMEEEEGASASQAIRAALANNLFGLEIDERCTQIGAFNVALTAWKLGGYQPLPPLQIACSGLAPHAVEKDWVGLADNDARLKIGMAGLHALFRDASVLGSLINPRAIGGDLVEADFRELRPLLERALAQEAKDDTVHEMAVTARGLAKAAETISGQFTLVATNVPYLGRGRQQGALMDYCERVHSGAKGDLATCFVERCLEFCAPAGSVAVVTPQNWLFLGTYEVFRKELLRTSQWDLLARLGPGAFETISGEVVNVVLLGATRRRPSAKTAFMATDCVGAPTPPLKAACIKSGEFTMAGQLDQLKNPDARIVFGETSDAPLFSTRIETGTGLQTFDRPRFIARFWEVHFQSGVWEPLQSTPSRDRLSSGMTEAVKWESGDGELRALMTLKELTEGYTSGIWRAGSQFWGKRGILHGVMSDLPCALYLGVPYDTNAAVLIPRDKNDYPAVLAFSTSGEFAREVRKLDQKMMVTNATFAKVPFDVKRWERAATERFGNDLPKPLSNDPTQWLFTGHPKGACQSLHVAVSRLLGYQWPRQTGSRFVDCPAIRPDGLEEFGDRDGIVCLPPINREQPAAQRLRALLVKALGQSDERALLADAGSKGSKSTTLEDWLRDEFFDQHCDLFHQRPFIWHVWDGRKDGFHALVNYHRLDHDTLKKVTYSYLGDWIRQQTAEAKADKPGAADRLGAAQVLQAELANILEGEPPYDIFVRWKPLSRQPVGWHPDLNDGVRVNIRPFMLGTDVGKKGAGVLRARPSIKWDKDRGKEPHRDKTEYPWFWCAEEPGTDPSAGKSFVGNRWNDVHLSLAAKRASRRP